jgi:ubiquinone/menaquinone biosynthesis C-methylase UbiE
MSNLSRTVAGFARAKNIRVLHSDFSHVDLPDCFADVVISNNAINLAVNVGDVVREAFRLLKPDGRAVFCEIIAGIELPKSIATDQLAFIGSIAGDLSPLEWQQALYGAGFRDVDLVVDKIYDFHEAIAPVCSMEAMHKAGKKRKELEEQFAGATIMARKPA